MIKPNKDQVAELRVSFEKTLGSLGFLDTKPFAELYTPSLSRDGRAAFASTDFSEGWEEGELVTNAMFIMHCAEKGFNLFLGIAE